MQSIKSIYLFKYLLAQSVHDDETITKLVLPRDWPVLQSHQVSSELDIVESVDVEEVPERHSNSWQR